jgi:two-component system NtrC family sensor kinase
MKPMIVQTERLSLYLQHAAPAFLTVAMSVPLWFVGSKILACLALLLGALSIVSTYHLVCLITKANAQKCYLDEQLIQSQKLASIGELSSGIAHEINNPLAIIGQEIEWMRHLLKENEEKGLKGIEDLTDSMQEIGRQVNRCREITHKLLDFARKKEPLIQGVEINKLIEDMVKLVEKDASHKDIKIIRAYRQDIPLVYTDPPLLRQVILNLLNNAAYAIGQNGNITVTTAISENRTLDIGIRDTGCGIPKEDINKIFDPFFTTKPPGKGTGLGLSICHGIIRRLGGKFSVESTVGKGTTVTVHLPLQQGEGEK